MAQDQAKLKKRLEVLLKLPENLYCSDCRKRGPRWASANLGVFFCIDCSGIHRNLGVHISFVRSVNLDTWTKAQVDFMEEWGNGRANEYFEANVPVHVIRPKDGDPVRVVEKFIRDKYEFKRFIAPSIPPKRESQAVTIEEDDAGKRRAGTVRSRPSVVSNVNTNNDARANVVSGPVLTRREFKPSVVSSAPAIPSQPPVQEVSLIDFLDDVAPSAPVVQQPSMQYQSADSFQQQSFAVSSQQSFTPDFQVQTPQLQQQVSQQAPAVDMFAGFTTHVPQQQQQQNIPTAAAPAKPQVSAADILSLYGAPASNPYGMQMGYNPNNMGGMNMGQVYPMQQQGNGLPMQSYPQQHQQQQQQQYPGYAMPQAPSVPSVPQNNYATNMNANMNTYYGYPQTTPAVPQHPPPQAPQIPQQVGAYNQQQGSYPNQYPSQVQQQMQYGQPQYNQYPTQQAPPVPNQFGSYM